MEDRFNKSLSELSEEIDELDQGAGEREEGIDTFENNNSLEQVKAEEGYEDIRDNSFEGFEADTSTPGKEGENSAIRKTSRVSKLVESFEKLDTSSESKSKEESGEKTGLKKRKYKTRTATQEEDSSPHQVLEPIKRKTKAASRRLQFGNMADAADIKGAKRLNPKERKIAETPERQGYRKLSKNHISISGKIIIKKLEKLIADIAKDTGLVIELGADTTYTLRLVEEYITEVKDILTEFQENEDDIDDTNADGQAAIEEMINLTLELTNLKRFCKMNAEAPAREEPIPVQKLKAQNFPKFDGTDDGTTFLNWKDQIEQLMPKVRDPHEKKNRLLDCLIKGAETFIKSVITPGMAYETLMTKLERRYNDPLVMNSKLLHQVFFGVEFNEPKSTLEHWDQAMGRIRALSDRGLTVEEVLLYYRLHKFDQSLVDKVMDRHRSLMPDALKMSLEDAETIMNRIVNDEQKF